MTKNYNLIIGCSFLFKHQADWMKILIFHMTNCVFWHCFILKSAAIYIYICMWNDHQPHHQQENRPIIVFLNDITYKVSTASMYQGNILSFRPEVIRGKNLFSFFVLLSNRSISDRFNMTMSSAFRSRQRIISALLKLKSHVIVWPEGK